MRLMSIFVIYFVTSFATAKDGLLQCCQELYNFKEAIHHLYRSRAYNKSALALTQLTDAMVLSTLDEIKRLRRTLMKGRKEILNFFVYRTTNARTVGSSSEEKAKE